MLLVSFNLVFLICLLLFQKAQSDTVAAEIPKVQKDYALFGTSQGLYYWNFEKDPIHIWKDGEVKKILRLSYGTFLLTSKGVYFSDSLKDFKPMNKGLIIKTVKHFKDGQKTFTQEVQELKDLKSDPNNPDNLITCSKDAIFYTTNKGLSWKSFPNPTTTTGIKSVLIFSNPDLQILFSHPFRGVYYKNITQSENWKQLDQGLYKYSRIHEEVSDLTIKKNEAGQYEIFAANNFNPNVYQLNLKEKKWNKIFKFKQDFAVLESLFIKNKHLYIVTNDGLMEYSFEDQSVNKINLEKMIEGMEQRTNSRILSLHLIKDNQVEYSLSDLWLLSAPKNKEYMKTAEGKRGVYMQADAARNKKRLSNIRDIMMATKQNMVTIDMKDDFGSLRFKPDSEMLKKMGRVENPLDLDHFISFMKHKNIYLVARIVTFKDKVLYHYNNYHFAIKDSKTGKPWKGVEKRGGVWKEKAEYWVDPYSEKVWEYNIEIARELIKRGFDEIQFDYIRFPTDGDNLHTAFYPSKDAGMDKESALISFLSYARENIQAPISVDIYGANGWHRTSARTGQDVELLQKYVDVIAPMYYPSHFSSDFLYFAPYDKRPYRIYYYGNFRNYYIGRKNVVIRPYIQVFKLNISYDKKYYGPSYISNQVKGVNNSLNMGYTFWNPATRYSILLDSLNLGKMAILNKKNLKDEESD